MTIETGTNLTALGFTWLGLHYLLPYIIGIILLALFIFAGIFLYNRLKNSNLTYDQILMGIVGAGLIIIIFLFR